MSTAVLERTEHTGCLVIKAVKRDRRIEGYFTTGDEDRQDEAFPPSWFQSTISPGGEYYNNPVVLYHHDANEVIGHADVDTLTIDDVGVYGEFIITSDERWKQIKDGDLRAMSWFGYVDYVNETVDLVEVTITPIPVNPKALFQVKKKALDLGKAREGDFPDSQAENKVPEEKQKGLVLGSWMEQGVALSALTRMQDALWSYVADCCYSCGPGDDDFETKLALGFDEFSNTAQGILKSVMSYQQTDKQAVSKAIAEQFGVKKTEDEPPTDEEPAADTGETKDMDETRVQQMIDASLQPVTKGIGDILALIQKPAEAPAAPAAPATPTEPVAATKALDLSSDESIAKLGAAIAAGITGVEGKSKALITGGASGAGDEVPEDVRQAKTKALIQRVKDTPYHGPNVEHKWGGNLRDAIALELTQGAQDYDEVPD